MGVFHRDTEPTFAVAGRWKGGFSWHAHPDEVGQRASHAIADAEGGVWLFDPLDAPGLDDALDDLGPVAGVVVCSAWHARDAGAIADRHGVPVSVPRWLSRVPSLVDAPVERFVVTLPEVGFAVRRYHPFPGWAEAVAWREADGTLVVPDALGTLPQFRLAGEGPLGVATVCRLRPPRPQLDDLEPERVLVGHGPPVLEGADAALTTALEGARRRLPRAALENGPTQLRSILDAVWN